jgi:hypothetical protein
MGLCQNEEVTCQNAIDRDKLIRKAYRRSVVNISRFFWGPRPEELWNNCQVVEREPVREICCAVGARAPACNFK